MDLRFTTAGFIVGSLVGATGVGGGSLMTPILLLLFNVPAGSAVGTDLLFAAITKGVGTGLHGLNQSISWRIVTRLAIGSIPASLGTLWLLHNVVNPESLSAILTTTLGVALVATSLAIFFQPLLRKIFRKETAPTRFVDGVDEAVEQQRLIAEEAACEARPESAPLTILTGLVLGVMVTMTSVGSGALGVMVLMALYPKVRSVRIVGTDIAHAVPLTLVAGLGHASTGVVDYDMLGSLLLGSIPGIALGSHVAFRLPEKSLKRILAFILLFVGGRLLVP